MGTKVSKSIQNSSRTLVAVALVTGGLFQLAAPVFAAGTAAGQQIINKATATYEDPTDPNNTKLNAESNTVTVTVAEVAGITVVGTTITDNTPLTGALPGDTLTYEFLITNTGNAASLIDIPAPVPTGPLTINTAGIQYQVDSNGDGTPDGPPSTTKPTAALPAGGQIKVIVPATVNTLATSGSPLKVQLGDTPPNDNTAATQNQPVSGVNNVQTMNAAGDPPVNGEREASAFLSINVADSVLKKAFATILKTSALTDPLNTPATLNDDTITYNLQLRVESNAPAGATGYTVEDLAGTTVTINGTATPNVIIVSDAIPAGTTLKGAITPPPGWTAVYSANNSSTLDAVTDWNTDPNAVGGISAVKRVGFYKVGTQAKGTTVTGFVFQVTTAGLPPAAGGTVYNIAQVLGTTNNNPSNLVYDESGDQNPSNFTDSGQPGNQIPTTGVADPNTDQIDPNNNNTGQDDSNATPSTQGGEDNVVNVVLPGSVLNGPQGQPAAIGPTDNNDDFTNKAARDLPADLSTVSTTYDPAPVSFTNTVNNPATSTTVTDVLLRPYVSSTTVGNAGYSNVPNGTTVTITYGTQSATYTYNPATFPTENNFVLTSGSPVKIPSIGPGLQVDYTIEVNLPTGVVINTGYSVPIAAFVDANSNSIPDATETQNRTIDRVYVGYLQLTKEVRVIAEDGVTVAVDWTANPDATFNQQVRPGRFLQYRVNYKNISSTGGAGSVILNAEQVVITENGAIGSGGNNWAIDNDTNGIIDTSNIVGSASDTKNGTVQYFKGIGPDPSSAAVDQTGTDQNTDVTKYVVTVPGILGPQEVGIFTFKRKIN